MYYLDASAAAKLVLDEPGSDALRTWLDSTDADVVSSDLLRTELLRAIRRHRGDLTSLGHAVLDSIPLATVTRTVYESAATLGPPALRSLDAIHLASAIDIGGDELDAIITYDTRLTEAAQSMGIDIVAPT